MELNNFTNKNNKRDIGVGNYNLKEKFYIRKELCLTFLSKWRFVKRSKEQKEEMEKWLKISKSKNLNIQIKSENNNNNNLNPEHFFMIEKNNISFINKNIKTIKPIIKSNNNNLVINSFNLNNIKEKKEFDLKLFEIEKNYDFNINKNNINKKIFCNIGINTENNNLLNDELENNNNKLENINYKNNNSLYIDNIILFSYNIKNKNKNLKKIFVINKNYFEFKTKKNIKKNIFNIENYKIEFLHNKNNKKLIFDNNLNITNN